MEFAEDMVFLKGYRKKLKSACSRSVLRFALVRVKSEVALFDFNFRKVSVTPPKEDP